MLLNEKFGFGKYKEIKLQSVYQGQSDLCISRKSLMRYLTICLEDKNALKPIWFELIEEFRLTEEEIIVESAIFNEEIPNSNINKIYLGNISNNLSNYFKPFFLENWLSPTKNLNQFNSNSFNNEKLLSADPEYINWLLSKKADFVIDKKVKEQLESLPIYRLMGISITPITTDIYKYEPCIRQEYYKF